MTRNSIWSLTRESPPSFNHDSRLIFFPSPNRCRRARPRASWSLRDGTKKDVEIDPRMPAASTLTDDADHDRQKIRQSQDRPRGLTIRRGRSFRSADARKSCVNIYAALSDSSSDEVHWPRCGVARPFSAVSETMLAELAVAKLSPISSEMAPG